MKLIVIDDLDLFPGRDESFLEELARKRYGENLTLVKIIRRSIDARNKNKVFVKYRCVFETDDEAFQRLENLGMIPFHEEIPAPLAKCTTQKKVLIIGSGPAGTFAALRLLERGLVPVILERGNQVEERDADIALLKKEGLLNTESNIVFGEGGAGTYSDGKLTTRVNKDGMDYFFAKMVRFGAPDSILYDAKPHVGTDVLSVVTANIRKYLTAAGCGIHFNERVDEFIITEFTLRGVRCASGKEYYADEIILATGHSARDIYRALCESSVSLEKKGFAAGVRIEHPAEFINRSQYGTFARHLPAADYRLVFNNKENARAVYSFCMCPGGEVINSSSEDGALCVNGMSYSKRDSIYSNSALVVSVNPGDTPGGVLEAVNFQRSIEQKAFTAGGGSFHAPASRVDRFVYGKGASSVKGSYLPGIKEYDFRELLPPFMSNELKKALLEFDRKIKGFISEGVFIGVETRTSSPVRIVRGADFQSVNTKHLYPAGEGAGYAGGIVSSAIDGIRIADFIASQDV